MSKPAFTLRKATNLEWALGRFEHNCKKCYAALSNCVPGFLTRLGNLKRDPKYKGRDIIFDTYCEDCGNQHVGISTNN